MKILSKNMIRSVLDEYLKKICFEKCLEENIRGKIPDCNVITFLHAAQHQKSESGPWKWRRFIMRTLSAYKHVINLTERGTLAELSCAIQTIIRKHLMKTRAAATHTHICAWQEVPSNKVFWWRRSVRVKPFFSARVVKPQLFVLYGQNFFDNAKLSFCMLSE